MSEEHEIEKTNGHDEESQNGKCKSHHDGHHCGHHCGHRHRRCRHFIFAILAILGIFWAASAIFGHHHHTHFCSHSTISERADAMAEHLSDHVDASEAQSDQIKAVAEAYAPRLQALYSEHTKSRDELIGLLAQPQVDRDKLELLRQTELARLDSGSQQLTQMMADIANILTVEQRQNLAEELKDGLHHWR